MERNDRQAVHRESAPIRLEFPVEWAPGHAGAYLLPGSEPVLVDAGPPGADNAKRLRDTLSSHGFRPADIDHILLTHAHTDHIGLVRTILESGPATVYAPTHVRERHERALETIETATRRNLVRAGLDRDRVADSTADLVEIHQTIRELLPLDVVDVWVEEGTPLEIGGFRMEPLYTPGHQYSHFCYKTTVQGEQVLFSGDMTMAPFRAPALHVNFDDGVRNSIHAFRDSLDRLERHHFDCVYPGHGPVHSEYRDVLERSIADIDDKVEACLDALEPSGTTAMQVVVARTGREVRDHRILAEVVGMLSSLESNGRVRSTVRDDVRLYEPVSDSHA